MRSIYFVNESRWVLSLTKIIEKSIIFLSILNASFAKTNQENETIYTETSAVKASFSYKLTH